MGIGAWGPGSTMLILLATAVVVGNNLLFVSDSGISCFQPASIKWWHPDHALARMQGKISGPLEFLTVALRDSYSGFKEEL